MRPSEIIRIWVERFNEGDADALADLYASDAINHQVPTGEFSGRERIRQMFRDEFASYEMNCIVENIFEDGAWAILEWKDPTGLRGCGFFKIENDLIVLQRGYWDRQSFLEGQ